MIFIHKRREPLAIYILNFKTKKIYELAYLSWKPSSLINCASRFACSRTGSIITASIDAKSANKYVYVLLTVSNICKEMKLVKPFTFLAKKNVFFCCCTCRKKKSLENGIRFEITGIDVILCICRIRWVWSVVLFSRRKYDWWQIKEIANLITCIQSKFDGKIWWKWQRCLWNNCQLSHCWYRY